MCHKSVPSSEAFALAKCLFCGKTWAIDEIGIVLSLPFTGGFKEIWEYRATVINNFSFTFEIKARHISLIQFHLDEAAVLAAIGNALPIIINITFRKV